MSGNVSSFIDRNFLHFNAATLTDAARAYKRHIEAGGKVMITLAGAMSTAELGILLAEMIRKEKVHIISSTGANLEEDIMNLVAHGYYQRVPHYRCLSPDEESELLERRLNRVTDTCIPEEEAFRRIQKHLVKKWKSADGEGRRYFPHEFLYRLLLTGELEDYYQIDPQNSWVLAAAQCGLPIICPGWEDSTLGNIFASYCIRGELQPGIVKSGIEYMMWLARWYRENCDGSGVGFFQIGGGIAGDFPVCVVPMLCRDLEMEDTPLWSFFCQISDSTTSYGSYSGAVPNEKISWGKLSKDSPKFIVESDASIVAPLIFAYVLGQ
jgi:deoxyhypusine synthase